MQMPHATVLSSFQASQIEARLRDLIENDQTTVEIVYEGLVSQIVDVEAGTSNRSENEDTIQALRHIVTVAEVERSGGTLQMGDRIYQVMAEDLTGTPTTSDRVEEDSVTRSVVDWELDALGLSYLVTARGGDAQ